MYILRITFKSVQKINNIKKNLLKLKKINKIKHIKIKGIFKIKDIITLCHNAGETALSGIIRH